jgi:hypothetical protein
VDTRVREELLKELNDVMTRRARVRGVLNAALTEFSTALFTALETVLTLPEVAGMPGVGKYRRLTHPAARDREAFQFFIEDWSIILVPLLGLARPNIDDEPLIAAYLFKQPCARIAAFLGDDPKAEAFYDFLIFDDRSWFAWGYGWPRQQATIEQTDFEALALELVLSFVKDIFSSWHPREDTKLSDALDPKKRCHIFGLPGDEQHGG